MHVSKDNFPAHEDNMHANVDNSNDFKHCTAAVNTFYPTFQRII